MDRQLRLTWIRVISVAVSMMLLVACGDKTAPSDTRTDSRALTSSDVTEVVAGNSLVGVPLAAGDAAWAVYYATGGIEHGMYGGDFDKGRWRVSNDMLCSNWDNWGDGERCFTLYRTDEAKVLGYSDGKHEWTAVVVPGDEQSLESREHK